MKLSVLPSLVLRLCLIGGGSLQPAWGPLEHVTDGRYLWDGAGLAYPVSSRFGRTVLNGPSEWTIDLSPASPWPARLAMVAAHLLRPFIERSMAASVYEMKGPKEYEGLYLDLFRSDDPYTIRWRPNGEMSFTRDRGRNWIDRADLDLPALDAHRAAHPPCVALLLALWDMLARREVPDVRAMVDGVEG